jgi:hypothetical protein
MNAPFVYLNGKLLKKLRFCVFFLNVFQSYYKPVNFN